MSEHKLAYAEPLHVAPSMVGIEVTNHVYLTNISGSFSQLIAVYQPFMQTPAGSYPPSPMIDRVVPRW